MKRSILALALLAAMGCAVANPEDVGAMVPASKASGGAYLNFASTKYDSKGNLLVCPTYLPGVSRTLTKACESPTGEGWVPLEQAVPQGRTLAGFAINPAHGFIIYWK